MEEEAAMQFLNHIKFNMHTFCKSYIYICSYMYIKKTTLCCPFLWMGFNCLKARATSRRQFTFTYKFPEILGTHLLTSEG